MASAAAPHRLPTVEVGAACRIDAIDGVSLQDLPERLRTVRAPLAGTSVVLPVGAETVRLPQ